MECVRGREQNKRRKEKKNKLFAFFQLKNEAFGTHGY